MRQAATDQLETIRLRTRGRGKAPRREFLRRNPFVHPRTEGFFYREKMAAIHAIAPDRPLGDILEVGGGQSSLTAMLYPQATVTNVDIDVDYARHPANRRPNVRFVAADATRLPFPDATFDAATCFDVLEHIPDDASAVTEVMRVVRPGGFVLVTSPNERWRFPYYRAVRAVCPTDADVMADWGHVRRGYAPDDLAQLFGSEPEATATFITPVTVVAHDLAFSRLPGRVRHGLCAALAPLTWTGHLLHRRNGRGTETASRWHVPLR